MDGFTFAGVHSSALGCWYRPAAKARGDDMPDFEISDLNPESRDGGYYIGSRVRPREFDLDCYFEDVTEETLVGIYRWLRRDTAGRLIFDSKPFIYYDVILSKRISITLYDHAEDGVKKYSGTFTASFTCYEPFGKLLQLSYEDAATQRELICTGILPTRMMPEAPGVASRRFLLYNPGTERAHTILRLAGNVGDGMLIRNLTTGQRCKVIGLTESSL